MKKKILTILSVFSIVASLTACNSATEAVKEPETAKNLEVSTYYMNGYYNPETKELTTVDAAGNCDIWDDIEILDLYKDAENDDEAIVFPGNYSVFKDHAKIFVLDDEIIVKEK